MPIQNHIRALGAAVLAAASIHGAQAQEGAQSQLAPEAKPAPAAAVKVFPQDPRRQIWFRHLKALPADIKTAGLQIDIKGAEEVAQRVTEIFRGAGYHMVPAEQAKYRYELRGSYSSDGKLKAQVPLAEILRGVEVRAGSTTSSAKAAGDVAFAAVLADQALKAGLISPLWASGDILNALFSATGLRDKFNTAVTGDRRGLCLMGCTYWEWSDQAVGLSWRDPRVEGMSTTSLVNVGVFAEGMFAEELVTLAFNEFLRHHGVLEAAAPEGEALMPIQQMRDVVTNRIKRTRDLIE